MRLQKLNRLVGFAVSLLVSGTAYGQGTIKVGLIAEFSGGFTQGKQIQNGIKAFIKEHGDEVAGKKVEIVVRDTKGPQPEAAKRLASELINQEKVDFLVGFGMTPNALAAASVATEAKKPMIIMNAAASVIPTKSPYIVRFSMTLAQVTEPMALWGAKNGIKRVVTIVSDYGPGIDSEATFVKSFTRHGGQVVESSRVPIANPDFLPLLKRAKDAKVDAVFLFVPAGLQAVSFMKVFTEGGLQEAGIKLIGPGDITDDDVLETMGDATLGTITTQHYSVAHDSAENVAFKKAYAAANGPNVRPNFMAVAGYDGMAAIYEVARKLGGTMDGDRAMEILRSYKAMSPRGPIEIDPATRDIVQSVYVRRVQRVEGKLYNVEFDRYPNFKDPK
jgi:branched-chain amino acid transport system substrate-binding protein